MRPAARGAGDPADNQIVHEHALLEVRLVLEPDAPADTSERVGAGVTATLAEAGAVAPPVRVTRVAEIEREPGAAAKLKLVVNRRPESAAG